MRTWPAGYIGIPFQAGARGPQFVDCWGLVRMVYEDHKKVSLPLLPFLKIGVTSLPDIEKIIQTEALTWVKLLAPEELCVVTMRFNGVVCHVGLWTERDGGLVIHAKEGQNVVAENLRSLRLRRIQIDGFYRYRT